MPDGFAEWIGRADWSGVELRTDGSEAAAVARGLVQAMGARAMDAARMRLVEHTARCHRAAAGFWRTVLAHVGRELSPEADRVRREAAGSRPLAASPEDPAEGLDGRHMSAG